MGIGLEAELPDLQIQGTAEFKPPPPMPRTFLCWDKQLKKKGTGVIWPDGSFAIVYPGGARADGVAEFVNQNEGWIDGIPGVTILRWQVGGWLSDVPAGQEGDWLAYPKGTDPHETRLGEIVKVRLTDKWAHLIMKRQEEPNLCVVLLDDETQEKQWLTAAELEFQGDLCRVVVAEKEAE